MEIFGFKYNAGRTGFRVTAGYFSGLSNSDFQFRDSEFNCHGSFDFKV